MIYLLDTNIVSETIKPKPNKNVVHWLSGLSNHHLAINVLTIGEIRNGIESLEDKAKKIKLVKWLEVDLAEWFADRIVSIDLKVADKWGYISSVTKKQLPTIDGLIAASAMVHGLKLVTRNIKDFQSVDGLELINPFEDE